MVIRIFKSSDAIQAKLTPRMNHPKTTRQGILRAGIKVLHHVIKDVSDEANRVHEVALAYAACGHKDDLLRTEKRRQLLSEELHRLENRCLGLERRIYA